MTTLSRSKPAVSFDPAKLPSNLFIDGKWRAGGAGKRIDVIDPSTGAVCRHGGRRDRRGRDGRRRRGARRGPRPGRPRRRAGAPRSCAAPSS